MGELKPLDLMRAIRDDGDLSRAEKAFFHVAVLRADNGTHKVKASLALLAEDSGFSPDTATRVFGEANSETLTRYFERIERQRRRIDLWLSPTPHHADIRTTRIEEESPTPHHAESLSAPRGVSIRTMRSSTPHHAEPSASIYSPSAPTAANIPASAAWEQARGERVPTVVQRANADAPEDEREAAEKKVSAWDLARSSDFASPSPGASTSESGEPSSPVLGSSAGAYRPRRCPEHARDVAVCHEEGYSWCTDEPEHEPEKPNVPRYGFAAAPVEADDIDDPDICKHGLRFRDCQEFSADAGCKRPAPAGARRGR
jgi:hypothetical protein